MIVVYITAHGLGHATRTLEVLKQVRLHDPGLPIKVVSRLPEWLLDSRLPGVEQREFSLDVGLVQRDAVEPDLPATESQLRVLLDKWDGLLEGEARWLTTEGATLVLADIPGIPLEAAAKAGITSVALGNFGWDWIYQGLGEEPVWQEASARFSQAYGCADVLLRYPLSEPMTAFPRIEQVGLVSQPGGPRRAELAKRFGADPGKLWLLFVFNSLQFSSLGLRRLESLGGCQLFTTGQLNWEGVANAISVPPSQVGFSDLLASVDGVVSKPGFGVVSDCLANDKPLLYVERENFREYDLLKREMEESMACFHLPLRDLYEGRLENAVKALRQGLSRGAKRISHGSGPDIAARILELHRS